MPKEEKSVKRSLKPVSPWIELTTSAADWDETDPDLLGTFLTQMHLVRAFEEQALELAGEGLVHGPVHASIGQEGGAVGSIAGLHPGDRVNGSHRGHHQFLAKALSHLQPSGFDPSASFSPDVEAMLQKTMAEIMGLAQGYCRGRGGSMHLRWEAAGALGTNAIVGGGVPLAAGSAMAQKLAGSDNITVTYFGDGAVNIGSVLETMNLAAAWKLPLCFFIENNRYAVATAIEETTRETRLSARGLGFAIPAWRVDGMNPLAVHLAMREAAAVMRSGKGPTIVEAEVYRYFHQSGPLPGSAFGYRSKEEEAAWRARDPIEHVAAEMIARGVIDKSTHENLRQSARATMQRIAARLTEPEGNRRRVIPALWPETEFVDSGLRGDLSELAGRRTLEPETYTAAKRQTRFVDAIADVLHRRLATDPSILVLGEDIHRLKGGTNGATRGLAEAFPDRVIGTPISEAAFTGVAGGLATDGRFRPVIEYMYPDFMWVAADQVFNQIGKARHMFGGDMAVPVVLRTKVAIGTGYGSQHSLDPAGIFATSPGWRIVAPSTPFDYVGLMNTAIACNDPVLVIEHVDLYPTTGLIPADDLDYAIPFNRAKIIRAGTELTILCYLSMVAHSLAAVEETGADAEIIDLRCLDRASLDWATIEASVCRTNNVMIVEEGALGTSYGTILADEIQRRLFDWLDQPVMRVTGSISSPSVSKILENRARATSADIATAIMRCLRNKGL